MNTACLRDHLSFLLEPADVDLVREVPEYGDRYDDETELNTEVIEDYKEEDRRGETDQAVQGWYRQDVANAAPVTPKITIVEQVS